MSRAFSSLATKLFRFGNSAAMSLTNSSVVQKNCYCSIVSNRVYSSSTSQMKSHVKPAEKEEEPNDTLSPSPSLSNDLPPPGIVFNYEKHNMYICWHPEVPFPYEMTKPIDLSAPVTESNLKIQALTPVREAFRQKHEKLVIQELVKLTYSTKHRFFGPFGKRKRLVLRSMDPNKQKRNREYL